jgi:ElaB/YqjD/DUF883 family membrane-anchored ribosome-binding protein
MNNLADDTSVRMHDFRAASAEGLRARRRLGKTVGAALGRLSERAKSAVRTTDEFVQVSPWQAAGIVAIVGLGVGLVAVRLSGRRRRARNEPAASMQGDL